MTILEELIWLFFPKYAKVRPLSSLPLKKAERLRLLMWCGKAGVDPAKVEIVEDSEGADSPK